VSVEEIAVRKGKPRLLVCIQIVAISQDRFGRNFEKHSTAKQQAASHRSVSSAARRTLNWPNMVIWLIGAD
jgi:hypothetical protein